MQIQIFAKDIENSDALRAYIERKLQESLAHMAEHLTRIEVHLKDQNSHHKNGIDKRCTLEARVRGMAPVAVEGDAESVRDAVHHAVTKLERALQHRLEKRKDH